MKNGENDKGGNRKNGREEEPQNYSGIIRVYGQVRVFLFS